MTRNLAPHKTPEDQQGFTPVELMVVVAILGVATTAVALNMRDPAGSVRNEAEAFAARTSALRDAAIIEGRDMAVAIGPQSYRFERRLDGRWMAMTEKPFAPVRWDAKTRANTAANGDLRIVFDPTGLPSEPAKVALLHNDTAIGVSIDAEGAVHVGS